MGLSYCTGLLICGVLSSTLLFVDTSIAQQFDIKHWDRHQPYLLDGSWYIKRGDLLDPHTLQEKQVLALPLIKVPHRSAGPLGQGFVGSFAAQITGLSEGRDSLLRYPVFIRQQKYFGFRMVRPC